MLDINTMADWLVSAPCGNRLDYHYGFLIRDAAFSKEMRDHRAYIMAASDAGLVNLMQKRTASDTYIYLAQRTSVPYQPGAIAFT